ncbi:BASS family bile acid:Na+ symporter [Branchiibius hedensis]|uniref:Bile acid:Na+ symporter, BASS family n=1 Tax=Branchiibius hedensis TaxID=672460 RepID=A0A2Y9A142_9MICO|nr:bile acid:sodium symporter family protein [Branchiibius hedensis]PWJ27409.1 BASS family bile acid:Na+ symporter [Branchiibius hedensis]SSA36219.1 bile acid:Na+ symporter, BASS family [Branchiibius hedensis]
MSQIDSLSNNTAQNRQDRSALIAVTIFPLLVLAAGAAGYLFPDTFTPFTPQVPYLLGIVMLCMGVTLTPPDFARIAKRPWVVLLGLVAHYVIMPLAGWAIAHALGLNPALAVGVILVGCAPSGTASNVMTYLAKGDVALSVSVATLSTLVAPVLTPLLTLWLAGSYLHVAAGSMFLDIVKTVLIPVILGVVIRLVAGRWVDRIAGVFPWVSVAAISLIVAIVMGHSAAAFRTSGLLVFVAVVLHNGFGLFLGYLSGKAARLDHRARRALAFEVGMQNSGLAASLAAGHFASMPAAALPPAIFSVWHNVSGAVTAAFFRRRPLPEAELAATEPDRVGATQAG